MARPEVSRHVKAVLICTLLLHVSFIFGTRVGDEASERARMFKLVYDLPMEINRKLGLEVSTVNIPKFSNLLWGTRQIRVDPDVVQIFVLYSNNIQKPPKVRRQTPEGLYECLKPILKAKVSQINELSIKSGGRWSEPEGKYDRAAVAIDNGTPSPLVDPNEDVAPDSHKDSAMHTLRTLRLASKKVKLINMVRAASVKHQNENTAKQGRLADSSNNIMPGSANEGAVKVPDSMQGDGITSVSSRSDDTLSARRGDSPPPSDSEDGKNKDTNRGQMEEFAEQTDPVVPTETEGQPQSGRGFSQNRGGQARHREGPLSTDKLAFDSSMAPGRVRSISIGEDERLIAAPQPGAERPKFPLLSNRYVPGGSEISGSVSPSLSTRSSVSSMSGGLGYESSSESEEDITTGDERESLSMAESNSQGLASKLVKESVVKVQDKSKFPHKKMTKIKKGVASAVKTLAKQINPKHNDRATTSSAITYRAKKGCSDVEEGVKAPVKAKDDDSIKGATAFRRDDRLRRAVLRRRINPSYVKTSRDSSQTRSPKINKELFTPATAHADIPPTVSVQPPPYDGVAETDSDFTDISELSQPDPSIPPCCHRGHSEGSCSCVSADNMIATGVADSKGASNDTSDEPYSNKALHSSPYEVIGSKSLPDNDDTYIYPDQQESSSRTLYEENAGIYGYRSVIYNPRDRDTLNKLIESHEMDQSFHEYAKSRYRVWERMLKDILRYLCDIEHFWDDEYLYDNDDSLVADIVDWHDPGPYSTYFPQDMVLQTSDRFITVEFEDNKRRVVKVAHQRYGGWFEPQVMIIFKSKSQLHRDIGWSLSNKSRIGDTGALGNISEKVHRFVAPVDQEEVYLDVTATGRLKRFPLWYYMYMKTSITIEDSVTPLTFSKVYRGFEFYTKSKGLQVDELACDVDKVERIAMALKPQIPVCPTQWMDLLGDVERGDAVGAFQEAYMNLLADMDVIFSGGDILLVPAFVKSRKTLFGGIITFVCLSILVTLLSLVSVFVMLTKSIAPTNRYAVTSYFVFWDMARFFGWMYRQPTRI